MEHPFAKMRLVPVVSIKSTKPKVIYKNPMYLKSADEYLPKKKSRNVKKKKKKKINKRKQFVLKRL